MSIKLGRLIAGIMRPVVDAHRSVAMQVPRELSRNGRVGVEPS